MLPKWKTAETSVFIHIYTQLEYCQSAGTTGLFTDQAGLGKTHAAREYASRYENVAIIDCSQYKTKSQFIRQIALELGWEHLGKLQDVKENLVHNLLATNKPLVILDEAGDLDYPAFLEIKALYNATEHACGWYMLGAQGLEQKMEKMRIKKKVGYEEIYDRLGARYQTVTGGLSEAEKRALMRHQAGSVLAANLPKLSKAEADAMLTSTGLNLRRLRKEIVKIQNAA